MPITVLDGNGSPKTIALPGDPSGLTPMVATISGLGRSQVYYPIAGRGLNVSLVVAPGSLMAVNIERLPPSGDVSTGWVAVIPDAIRLLAPPTFPLDEPEAGTAYSFNCVSYSNGSAAGRIGS